MSSLLLLKVLLITLLDSEILILVISTESHCEIIFDLNLCQLVNEPTHTHSNILDLVLTNNLDNAVDLTVHSKLPLSLIIFDYIQNLF